MVILKIRKNQNQKVKVLRCCFTLHLQVLLFDFITLNLLKKLDKMMEYWVIYGLHVVEV